MHAYACITVCYVYTSICLCVNVICTTVAPPAVVLLSCFTSRTDT